MFTGLIDHSGRVASVEENADGARIEIATELAPTLKLGDSVAINGACMTVASLTDQSFTADVMHESLRRTSLGALSDGDRVNLELPLAIGDRLDGHIVQGHVDGVGHLVSRTPGPRWDDLVFAAPADLLRYVATRGSIAVNGTSLTVTHVSDEGFGVSLIPTTLEATNLGRLEPGDRVNLEVDVIAKYVERLLGARS